MAASSFSLVATAGDIEIARLANRPDGCFRMIPVPTLSKTRRNIRVLLALGSLLAILVGGMGGAILSLGHSRPDVTQPFWEFGGYVLSLCLVNLAIFLGLFWQVSRLSRRPEPPRNDHQIKQTSPD